MNVALMIWWTSVPLSAAWVRCGAACAQSIQPHVSRHFVCWFPDSAIPLPLSYIHRISLCGVWPPPPPLKEVNSGAWTHHGGSSSFFPAHWLTVNTPLTARKDVWERVCDRQDEEGRVVPGEIRRNPGAQKEGEGRCVTLSILSLSYLERPWHGFLSVMRLMICIRIFPAGESLAEHLASGPYSSSRSVGGRLCFTLSLLSSLLWQWK